MIPSTKAGRALVDHHHRPTPTSAEAIEGRRTLVEAIAAIEAEARAAALEEAIAAVGKLRAYKLPNVSNPFVEYAAVLEALRGKR